VTQNGLAPTAQSSRSLPKLRSARDARLEHLGAEKGERHNRRGSRVRPELMGLAMLNRGASRRRSRAALMAK